MFEIGSISALNFRSGAYNFHKLPKNPFRSITILHVLADFAVPETIIFKISNFNPFIAFHGRLSPNAKPSAAARVSGRSGDSHIHAQNGSARSGAPHFHASSKRLKLVPEPHNFTLIFLFAAAHTYQNSTPPPPRGGQTIQNTIVNFWSILHFGLSQIPPTFSRGSPLLKFSLC